MAGQTGDGLQPSDEHEQCTAFLIKRAPRQVLSPPLAHLNCTTLLDSDKEELSIPTLQMKKLRLGLRRSDPGLRHDLLSKCAVASKCLVIIKLQQRRVPGVISQSNRE